MNAKQTSSESRSERLNRLKEKNLIKPKKIVKLEYPETSKKQKVNEVKNGLNQPKSSLMKKFQSTNKEQSDSLKTKQETLESTDTELTETTALLNQRLKQLRNEKVISTDKYNQSNSQTKSTPGDHLNKLGEKIYIEPIKESETFKPNI